MNTNVLHTIGRGLMFWGALTALGLCLVGTQILLDRQRPPSSLVAELSYLPKGEYLKVAVLGYRQLVADLIWMRAVQHIGAKRDTAQGYGWTYHAVDVLTDLDPTFLPPYQATGVFLGVLAGHQREALALLGKGIRNNPSAWRLPFLAGYVSYYELCDPVAGGEYLRAAAQVPGAPAYLPRLAARMTVEGGDPTAAVEFLDRFSRSVSDERVRGALVLRMQEVVQEKDLRILEKQVAQYRTQYGKFPDKLEELFLSGTVAHLPVDPLGGQYQIDPISGLVSASSNRERLRMHNKLGCQRSGGDARSQVSATVPDGVR